MSWERAFYGNPFEIELGEKEWAYFQNERSAWYTHCSHCHVRLDDYSWHWCSCGYCQQWKTLQHQHGPGGKCYSNCLPAGRYNEHGRPLCDKCSSQSHEELT